MGNKQKKSPKKLLFELDGVSEYQPKNSQITAKTMDNSTKPLSFRQNELSEEEFIQTLGFCNKTQAFYLISEPQLNLTQANCLFLNYNAFRTKEAMKIHSLLNHTQIIQTHSQLEYLNELNLLAKNPIYLNKSVDMSPIQLRNSNKPEEFNTPSPLKSEFKGENPRNQVNLNENVENAANDEILQRKSLKTNYFSPENMKENEDLDFKTPERNNPQQRTICVKPNFVHFPHILPEKKIKEEDPEEKLRLSLKRLDLKLKKAGYCLKENREKSNDQPKYLQLDLWKMKEKPSYSEISAKKLRNFEFITKKPEILQDDIEEISYNLKDNRIQSFKKLSSKENLRIKSDYSQENLKKYLNKSHSDFSNNARFLADKKTISPGNFAENRGNFIYMNYDFSKKKNSLRKMPNVEKENLETSLINLKKSLNLPQNAMKIIKKIPLQEKKIEEPLDMKNLELEKLRRSLVLSKKMRLSNKEN